MKISATFISYDDTEMLAAVIGARIAEHIFPNPMQEQIRNAVDYLLTYNNPDFLDKAQIDSLVIILQETISDLKKKSEQMRNDAWSRLLPAM